MSKRITQEEFLERFYRNYPEAKIEIIEYTAISKPATVRCLICNKVLKRNIARQFLNGFDCCNAHNLSRLDKIKIFYKENQDFEFIKSIDKDTIVIKHLICGNEIRRGVNSCLDNPYSCTHCGTHKTNNMLSKEEIQRRVDEAFDNKIEVLEYNGFEGQSYFKCLKCGLIFTQKYHCLIESRGCPKCDRWQSKGEKQIAKLLQENNIKFQEQYSVEELPLQKFDFAILDENDAPIAFIEVQGENHFRQVSIFDDYKIQQERDERKRKYCKKYNIPLYELIYLKGKFKNLEILPFQFNDYLR